MTTSAEPKIVSRPAFKVAGLLLHAKPADPEIGKLWGVFGPRMDEVKHVVERDAAYGVMDHFDQQMTGFDYLAAVEVENAHDLPPDMVVWDIPAQTYAVYPCTLPTIMEAYQYLYGTWQPNSGYRRAPGPEFEYYGADFHPDDSNSRFYLYIPVEKAS